jgi:peptidoglycan/xylan/chitin deacetylase (PgdA/CDA1 family)
MQGMPDKETRVTVLMYHGVGDAYNACQKRYCISAERFESHLRLLQSAGMVPCTIERFVAWLEGDGTLPERSFVLTFDDGFYGVYEHAFPLLVAMGWPATIFLVSGLIGKENIWTARANPAGKTYRLLGAREIEEMAGRGFSFHSHTRSHPDLRKLSSEALREELAGAREDLENLLERRVGYLAYPFGWFDDKVIEAAKASGYRAAFSTHPGFNRRDVDRYRIRRLDVYGSDTAHALLRKIALGTNDGSWWHSMRYYGERVAARLRRADPFRS